MKRHWVRIFIALGLFLPQVALGGAAAKTGIVKGTINIGGKPTSDAVVSVEGLPPDKSKIQNRKSKIAKAVIDQRDMKFTPRVLAVIVGTTVEFPNNDKAWHNVFSASEAKKFDLGLYPPGKTRNVAFDKPGVVRVLCNVHPSMEAYVVVKGHPYFAASDKGGNYRINNVPLGKYRIEVWHPDYGTRTVPFELVREGEVLAIDVDLKK